MERNNELNKLAYDLFVKHFLKEYENVSWIEPMTFEVFLTLDKNTKYHKKAKLIIRNNILKKIKNNF